MDRKIITTDLQEKALNFVSQRDSKSVEDLITNALERGIGSFIYDMQQANFQAFAQAEPDATKADVEAAVAASLVQPEPVEEVAQPVEEITPEPMPVINN